MPITIYWFIVKDNVVSDIKETDYNFVDESLKSKLPDPKIEGVWSFKKQESNDVMCVSNNVIHLHFFRTGLVYWKEDKNV